MFLKQLDHGCFDVYMSLTGLQMRTASTPVISKAQSKPRLHQGKTPQLKNTGVVWECFSSLVLIMLQSEKITGLKLLRNFKTERICDCIDVPLIANVYLSDQSLFVLFSLLTYQ